MNIGYDVLGNIAILKFSRDAKLKDKKKFAESFLKKHKNVTTVLEKSDKFKGRLRVQKTTHLAGEKTKEALYKENDCIFRLNVDTCYFSPRLSSERKELASKVKKNESVLVMFAGVAPHAVIIGKQKKAKRIVSIELGRKCNKYAKVNVKRNKLDDLVELIQGDVRKRVPLLKEKFDRIIMSRPNLKDSFLDVAFPKIKKGGVIYYYGFYKEDEVLEKGKLGGKLKELIETEAKKAKKKIKIIGIKKAGDIGPYKYRYRVDFKVLN